MIDPPQIVQTTAQPIALIHLTVPRSEVRAVMGPGLAELRAALLAQGIVPTGRWLTHHLRMPSEMFDFVIGLPVTGTVAPVGRVTSGELPATTVARTVYHGPYEGLSGGWEKFGAWITAQGHTAGPSLWESYLSDPSDGPDPATWRTELTRPLVR